ncbi:T9SS type A sorting domain-containing protein [Winogradskyella flava]|uniref:T9SS type A sorting domain-containing protein n=1 Tax=Winogradskyella flava TaxID=1884876 RepID=A0A842IQB3_9FLAO|nr:T9SS type A sorting domain-containing protein [Winogradskyella flava]MBC2843914.1 T9SS type A sorting domain-containing protein [Winogradskyella flava]
MKSKLPLLLSLFISINMFAQLNVWTGMIDDKWSDENNWSGTVPLPSDDVLIPSGFVVTIDTPANVLSIEVQGNSVLNVTSSLVIANPSEFEDNVVVNWSSGDLSGGGILLNSGTINMSFVSFDISGSSVLNNPGTINMVGGNILISSDSVLNNSGTGIINFVSNGGMFGATSGDLINQGTIKTSFSDPSHQAFMACDIINQDGIFQIDTGTLNINNTVMNIMGAEFNVLAGATLNLNSPMTVLGVLFGNVFGDLNWNDDLIVPTTAVLDFGGNEIINCTGNLEGGGSLTNLTTINQIGGSALQISGNTIIENEGVIQLTSGPGIAIGTNSILNNNASGEIDIQSDGAGITFLGGSPNILNNIGLIKVSFQSQADQSIFSAQLNNNNGTIQVDNGILWLSNANTTLTDGVYNIAASATLQWTQPITIAGTLTGNLGGNLAWQGDLLVPTTASFNFAGNGSVDWTASSLTGGGILTNEHTINILNSGGDKRVDGAATLINNAEIKSSGFIRIGTNSTLNNSVTGTIDIDTFGSSFGTVNNAPHTFINSGLLIASLPANITVINAPLSNFGIIEVTTAEIDFTNTLVNETSGIIRGAGTIDLPNSPGDFINNGTFSPGLSPGVLTVLGDYSTTVSSILNIELNGSIQGSEYDLLAINGNADLNGDIQITLGFNPDLNDEFVVTTVSGTINTCNLPTTVAATFDGFDYEFDFACNNNDELILTVSEITLGISDEEEGLKTKVYPNPAKNIVHIKSSIDIESIKLFDISGKLVLVKQSNTFSVESLLDGIYILEVIDFSGRTLTQKLIKR